MVKYAYIPFKEFLEEVCIIEDGIHWAITKNWADGKIVIPGYDIEKVKNLMFLHYPYHKSYLAHHIDAEMKDTVNFEDIGPEDDLDSYDMEFGIGVRTNFSVKHFLEDRIVPFIKSAISVEEYNKYYFDRVLIGLERNTALILSDERGWDVRYDIMELDSEGKLSPDANLGKIHTVKDGAIYSLGHPMHKKFYGIYKDTGEMVFLGDCPDNLYSTLIIKAQLQSDGTAYMFNNYNLE